MLIIISSKINEHLDPSPFFQNTDPVAVDSNTSSSISVCAKLNVSTPHFPVLHETKPKTTSSTCASASQTPKVTPSSDRLLQWTSKIHSIDPKASVNHHDPLIIWCGRCGKSSTQRNIGSTERFVEHRKSKKCTGFKGKSLERKMTAFFTPGTLASSTLKSKPEAKASATASGYSPCPGIGERQDSRILEYLTRTPVAHGGGPPREKLLNKIKEIQPDLSVTQLEKAVKAESETAALWQNWHMSQTVRSSSCTHTGTWDSHGNLNPCIACMGLLKLKTFKNALQRGPGDPLTAKFTPTIWRNPLIGEAYARHRDVKGIFVSFVVFSFCNFLLTLICTQESSSEAMMWRSLASRGLEGRYAKNHAVAVGVIQAMMAVEDRQFKGKKLTNMQYNADAELFFTNLALTSPQAYRMFKDELGGLNLRTVE
jgi:hypothetical protein